MSNHTLITINRQFGSGGKEISEILAKKMGVRCYDRQILYLAAEKMGNADVDAATLLNDAYQVAGNSFKTLGGCDFFTASYYNQLYTEQAKLIMDIAQREDAVFLGRCADAILSDYPDCFSFYIYADENFRSKRAKTYYDNMTIKELDKVDKSREHYYKHYTGKDWSEPTNYNLMINTSECTLEDAADLILHYVKQKTGK